MENQREKHWDIKGGRLIVEIREDSVTLYLNSLSDIRPIFLKNMKQAVELAELMICRRNLAYIPQICFIIENAKLSQLHADMRRLKIICEIITAESLLSSEKSVFLDNINSFDELIKKYIHTTFLLRRLEFQFPESVIQNTIESLYSDTISICAIRKITENEIFANSEYVYKQAVQIIRRR